MNPIVCRVRDNSKVLHSFSPGRYSVPWVGFLEYMDIFKFCTCHWYHINIYYASYMSWFWLFILCFPWICPCLFFLFPLCLLFLPACLSVRLHLVPHHVTTSWSHYKYCIWAGFHVKAVVGMVVLWQQGEMAVEPEATVSILMSMKPLDSFEQMSMKAKTRSFNPNQAVFCA